VDTFLLIVLILALTGAFAGFASGMLGVGGAFVMVPVQFRVLTDLLMLDDTLAIRVAFATSLAVALPTAVSGAAGHHRCGVIEWRAAGIMGASGFLGGILGGMVATSSDAGILRVIFAILLVIIAAGLFVQTSPGQKRDMRRDAPVFAVLGFSVGILSGLLGIGGGIAMVPALIIICGFPAHRAVGTSSAFILFASLGGILIYVLRGLSISDLPFPSLGYIDLFQWLVLSVVTVPMAQVGVRAAHRLPARYLEYILIVVLLYSALSMLGIL